MAEKSKFKHIFESYLVPGTNHPIDILSMSDSDTVGLRNIVAQSVTDYRAMVQVRNELQALEDRYAQWTNELAQLNNDINYLQQQKLPYLEQEKQNAQEAIDLAQVEIPQYKNMIANEKVKLKIAGQDYQTAYDN